MANKEFAQQIELDEQFSQRYPFYGGLPSTISQLNINQLRHYHNRCYRPQYMTLISSGAWSLSSLWQIVAQSLTHLKPLQPNTDPKLLYQATKPSSQTTIELGDTLSQQMKWFLYSFLQHDKDAQDWLAQHQLTLVNQPLDLAWITPIRIHSHQKQTIDSSLRQPELLKQKLLKLLVNSLATQSTAQYHYYLALLGTEYWRQQYQKSGKDLAHLYQQFEQSLNQWQLVQSPDIKINEKQPIAALIQQLTANGLSQLRPKTAVTQLVSGKKWQWLQIEPQQIQLTITSNKPQLIQAMRLYLVQLQQLTQLYCQQQQLACSSHLTQQGGSTSLILICHHQHSKALNGYWLQQLSQTLPLTSDVMPSCHPIQQLIQQTFTHKHCQYSFTHSINLMALIQQQESIKIELNQKLIADNISSIAQPHSRILSNQQPNSSCLGMQLVDTDNFNQQTIFATVLAKLLMLQTPIQQLRLTGQVYALDYQYDPLQQQLAWYSMIDQAPKLTLEALKQCLIKLFSDKQKHHSQLQLIMPSISIDEFNDWLEYQESQLKPNPKGGVIPT
ncbi:insulinase family protein [Shewanella marina]|uniref:insulinase family protein n=1 Tax=Shewanella marina TaxID=487319 RepID=UPI00046F909A|nr:insulinase family protein [Shewanella marina]